MIISSVEALAEFIQGLERVQETASEYGTLVSCVIEFHDSDFSSGPGKKTGTTVTAKFEDHEWVLDVHPTTKES